MTLIPAFEIGVWNAWIPMLYFPLHPLIMMLIHRLMGVGDLNKKMGSATYSATESRIFTSAMALMLLGLLYSVFLPLKLGTTWFYTGLPICLVGLAMLMAAIVTIATAPEGKPFTQGAYRYSRHPMILWGNVIHLGVSIASASWAFLLFSIAVSVLYYFLVVAEERGCLKYYGDAYRDYVNRTPRWLGIPKQG